MAQLENVHCSFDLACIICRGKNPRGKSTYDGNVWATETEDQPSRPAADAGEHNDVSEGSKAGESESEAVFSLQHQAKLLEQNVVKVKYYSSYLKSQIFL